MVLGSSNMCHDMVLLNGEEILRRINIGAVCSYFQRSNG